MGGDPDTATSVSAPAGPGRCPVTASAVLGTTDSMRHRLFETCQHGRWTDIIALFNQGANPSWCDQDNRNILHYVCLGDNFGVAPLMRVTSNDNLMSKLLRDSDNNSETPFMMACRLGRAHLVTLWLALDAMMIMMPNENLETPLHIACEHGHAETVGRLLSVRCKIINARDCFDEVPLHKAVRGGNISVVRKLLSGGADANCKNAFGRSALHLSVYEERWQIMELILKEPGLCIDEKDASGSTDLHVASSTNSPWVVDVLLAHGANPRTMDHHHDSPLHTSAMRGQLLMVKSLLAAGVDINIANKTKDTALGLAGRGGHTEIVRLLLEYGAKLSPGDSRDAVFLAKLNGHERIGWMLTEHFRNVYSSKGVGEALLSYLTAQMVHIVV